MKLRAFAAAAALIVAATGAAWGTSALRDAHTAPLAVETTGTAAASEPSAAAAATPVTEPAPEVAQAPRSKPKRRAAQRPAQVQPAPSGDLFSGLFGVNLYRFLGISLVPRSTVAYAGQHKPGTIVIHTDERRLYLVLGNGQAIRYGIGVGRDGFRWKGVRTVTMKREWPSWTPPPQMLKRQPNLPRHMAGGPDNPLGARALYLGDSLYRIHGTNEYDTIGTASSSGCFRLTNEDVIDLYNRVSVGATVIVR